MNNTAAVTAAITSTDICGDPTLSACLEAARHVATGLDQHGITTAFISPSPAGGFGFYWHVGPVDVSLEIELEENIEIYLEVRNKDMELDAQFIKSPQEAVERLCFWLACNTATKLSELSKIAIIKKKNHSRKTK